MPACDAPVCDERSVSHSTSRCVPSLSQRAIVGALPSRIASWRIGSPSPSISRKMIPGASVSTRSLPRFAIRAITCSEYVSSSSVPKRTPSATPADAATIATRSADQNESIESWPFVRLSASSRIPASRNKIAKKPTSKVSGSRSAATIGGRIAFRIPITTAATSAAPKPFTCAPGTIAQPISSDSVATSHVTRSLTMLKRGRAGRQMRVSP